MILRTRRILLSVRLIVLAFSVALAICSPVAAISVGQVDDFESGSTQNWLGANVEAVADAGPNGAGDTALRSSATGSPFGPNGKLIVYNVTDRWTENWTAAGVVQISLDVRNPNAFPLTMRLAIAGPDGFFAGGGGDTHSTDGISVAEDNAWHSITFDVLAENFTPLDPTYPDVAAALAEVTHFRILHNPEVSFLGAVVDADFYIDNIRALGAPALVPGDYNRNGTVDAADYVLWRKTLNQSVPNGSGADGTGPVGTPDGVVDGLDYDFWRSQFGSTSGAAGSIVGPTSVPEPATLGLVLSFALAIFRRCRRSGTAG
jgi:hypothetical protein